MNENWFVKPGHATSFVEPYIINLYKLNRVYPGQLSRKQKSNLHNHVARVENAPGLVVIRRQISIFSRVNFASNKQNSKTRIRTTTLVSERQHWHRNKCRVLILINRSLHLLPSRHKSNTDECGVCFLVHFSLTKRMIKAETSNERRCHRTNNAGQKTHRQ